MTDAAINAREDSRINIEAPGVAILTLLLLLSFAGQIAMPFNINGIVTSFTVTNTAAGLVATIEMGGVALGSLAFSQLAPRVAATRIYVPALTFIILINVATIWAPTINIFYGIRGVAGIAAGAIIATIMATAGRTTKPEFTFAAINSGVGVMAMILSLLLPQALVFHMLFPAYALSAADGLYGVYAFFALLALAVVRFVPMASPVTASGESHKTTTIKSPLSGWIALPGMGLMFFGHAALLMFIVNIGVEQVGLSTKTVGLVFLFGSAFGIVMPFVASWLSTRFPALLLIGVLAIFLALGGVLLGHVQTRLPFYVIAPPIAMLPAAMMPILLGALARIDPSGRLTGAHPAFVMLGASIAPLVGGAISSTGDYAANGWLVAICVGVAAPMLYSALRHADRSRLQHC